MNLDKFLCLDIEERLKLSKQLTEQLSLANKKYNILINQSDIAGNKNGLLANIPYVCKDNIATAGVVSTGGSPLLKNYISPFDATVVAKLKQQGAICIGKSNLDELGLGGSGINPYFGATLNPLDVNRKAGGSSGGSAAAVAAGVVPFALGTDTGDSIRKPASYTGVVGVKPTYGLISRYGVFPFACSLDHVGLFTSNVYDSAFITSLIAGYDEKDATTSKQEIKPYHQLLKKNVNGIKIGVIKEIVDAIENKAIKEKFQTVLSLLQAGGAIVQYHSFDLKLLKAILPVYLIISSAEATSNNANLTGIIFGDKKGEGSIEDIIKATRTTGFGKMIKRRFMIGSYILEKNQKEKYFIKAQKVRRLIVERFNQLLDECDVLMMPAAPSIAPLIQQDKEEIADEYLIADNYMAIANFAGTPSITIPMGNIDNMPIGVNINTALFKEQEMFNIAYFIEQSLKENK